MNNNNNNNNNSQIIKQLYTLLIEENTEIEKEEEEKEKEETIINCNKYKSYFCRGDTGQVEIIISVKEFGYLEFPFKVHKLKELVSKYEVSTEKNQINIWELPLDKVGFESKPWSAILESIINNCKERMGIEEEKISTKLDKFMVFNKGGSLSHTKVSSQENKKTNIIGTLILVLPSFHQGGELIVKCGDDEAMIDLENYEPSNIYYTAFLNDCEYEIKPIESGVRLCLVYNLIKDSGKRLPSSSPSSIIPAKKNKIELIPITQQDNLYVQLQNFFKINNKFVYILNQSYKSFEDFEGQDKLVLTKLLSIEKLCAASTYLARLCLIKSKGFLSAFIKEKKEELNLSLEIEEEAIVTNKNIKDSFYPVLVFGKQEIFFSKFPFDEIPKLILYHLESDNNNNIPTDTEEAAAFINQVYFHDDRYVAAPYLDKTIEYAIDKYLPSKGKELKRSAIRLVLPNCKFVGFFLNLQMNSEYFIKEEICIIVKISISSQQLRDEILENLTVLLNYFPKDQLWEQISAYENDFINHMASISEHYLENMVSFVKASPTVYMANFTNFLNGFKILKDKKKSNREIFSTLVCSIPHSEDLFVPYIKKTTIGDIFEFIIKGYEFSNSLVSKSYIKEFILHNQQFFVPMIELQGPNKIKSNIVNIKIFLPTLYKVYPAFIETIYKDNINHLIQETKNMSFFTDSISKYKDIKNPYFAEVEKFYRIPINYNFDEQANYFKSVQIELLETMALKDICNMGPSNLNITIVFFYKTILKHLPSESCKSLQSKYLSKLAHIYSLNIVPVINVIINIFPSKFDPAFIDFVSLNNFLDYFLKYYMHLIRNEASIPNSFQKYIKKIMKISPYYFTKNHLEDIFIFLSDKGISMV
ncbi:hypothetical protein DICPUDRAFT_75596 [Dictyostelium purpureum]|uniref:Prolyl 4-hydroxylase alpha subunit Fe(2+) 2OG dioxygenase domain-containing protein n=1 Tax=Dictyostelium purpureum TaxID=5786 RepID=F0ZB43_DICPU|nr:uncharacterized protein DICPUDRAFT_75596 [Dictyostelium purpureum]EGC38854.1 hypothetical protein DICPUDRAFT_75596 [Dictyostelium purpureum]|eukprot:XP_003284648.1 hypothetical protein DICPUDRAFT_75596 [Dictyostelium purpureum]